MELTARTYRYLDESESEDGAGGQRDGEHKAL